jgi:predicted dienelactone hydrolase
MPQQLKQSVNRILSAALISFAALPIGALSAQAAETIRLSLFDVSFDVTQKELQNIAQKGYFTGQWAFLNSLAKPEGLKQIQTALTYTPPFKPETISNIFSSPYSPSFFLQRASLIFQNQADQPSDAELKQAILVANQLPGGLNFMNFVAAYPDPVINVDLNSLQTVAISLKTLVESTESTTQQIIQKANTQADQTAPSLVAFSQAGPQQWTEQSFAWVDASRNNRAVPTTLYLPTETTNQPLPLVVISHGLGEDRQTLSYLAQHLASYGYAVVVPEHVGSNATKGESLFDGYSKPTGPSEAVNRPQDVTFVLNQLSQLPQLKQQIDTQKVIVVGHSLGGYTALALAGGTLDIAYLRQACNLGEKAQLNMSIFLQCPAAQLPQSTYQLGDSRVVGIVSADPVTSKFFSPASLQNIKIPTMLLAGSFDTVVPIVREATPTYSELGTDIRYFVMLQNGTHFSVLPKMEGGLFQIPPALLGPSQDIGNRYFKALTLAFADGYLKKSPQAQAALNQGAAIPLSQPEMPLFIVEGGL